MQFFHRKNIGFMGSFFSIGSVIASSLFLSSCGPIRVYTGTPLAPENRVLLELKSDAVSWISRIDGRPVPDKTAWSKWVYELEPGTHTVSVNLSYSTSTTYALMTSVTNTYFAFPRCITHNFKPGQEYLVGSVWEKNSNPYVFHTYLYESKTKEIIQEAEVNSFCLNIIMSGLFEGVEFVFLSDSRIKMLKSYRKSNEQNPTTIYCLADIDGKKTMLEAFMDEGYGVIYWNKTRTKEGDHFYTWKMNDFACEIIFPSDTEKKPRWIYYPKNKYTLQAVGGNRYPVSKDIKSLTIVDLEPIE